MIMLGPCYLIVILGDDQSLPATAAGDKKSYGVTARNSDNVLF